MQQRNLLTYSYESSHYPAYEWQKQAGLAVQVVKTAVADEPARRTAYRWAEKKLHYTVWSTTHILTYLAELLTWAAHNGMEINTSKTKEMVLGRLANTNLPLPNIASQTVERVTTYKLLGVHIDSTLSWSTHIEYIIKKATRRLYFLKQLQTAGLPNSHFIFILQL